MHQLQLIMQEVLLVLDCSGRLIFDDCLGKHSSESLTGKQSKNPESESLSVMFDAYCYFDLSRTWRCCVIRLRVNGILQLAMKPVEMYLK